MLVAEILASTLPGVFKFKRRYLLMKHLFPYLLTLVITTCTLHSLIVIQGDATTAPYGFTVPITTMVLQKSTGTLFVGLGITQLATNFSIAKAFRPNFLTTPKFIGIATDPNIQGADIEFLTVSDQIKGKAILPFVIATTNNFEAKNVSAIFDNGTSFTQTIALNDANNETTKGIAQLATSMAITTTTNIPRSSQGISYVFAAVRPNAGDFGDANSGVALMSLTSTGTTINFNTLNAQTGQTGNRAEPLDAQSTELKGDRIGGGDVIFSTETGDENRVALYYDDPFERLYIGVRIATGATAGDIGKSVVIGRVNVNGLILEPITPDNTIDPVFDQIVVAENDANLAGPNLRANRLSVMHTSAGPSYLIVQGGIGQTNEVGNTIFALPLVDDPSAPAVHGTLANKNEPLENFVFTTPATLPSQLATAQDPAAFVGGGTLPILPSDQISNMVVVGDAVFISIELEPTATNDTGIFYSQALFDAQGKIINWTPWTKRASPIDLFPQIEPSVGGGVQFFDVDASTGNIYIATSDQNLVGVTAWTEHITTSTASDTPIPLINALNEALPEGSYSVLDLPQSVRGFTATTTAPDAPISRYALFGGVNTVAFARISKADTTDPDSPQTVITDFDDPENFLLTKLPAESGCVQVLEYSRRTSAEDDTNYFFAGTENGLFAFATTTTDGEGFNVDELSTLDQPPFKGGKWYKIPEINGSVIDIKSSGLALYVLTFETSAETPLKHTLYAVSFEPTLEEMFNPTFMNVRILAQTKTEPVFETTQLFTGMQIIATGDPNDVEVAANKEQLILATNQGLYTSHADQVRQNRGIADADDQIAAMWELIPTTTNTMYTGISGIETPIRHTTWPLRVQAQECRSFDASSVEQLSGNGDDETGDVGFAPTFFNADIDTPAFKNLEPITYFFSDGGRRFFIVNPTATSSSRTQLSVIPFDTQAWHLASPHILKYPPLPSIERFFWVQTIGMSGFVLAGTDRGVIGLG